MSFSKTQKYLFQRGGVSRFVAAKAYDPATELYTFEDPQYVGFCFEFSLLISQGEDSRQRMEDLLNRSGIPDDSVISFLMWASPDIQNTQNAHYAIRQQRFVSTGNDESDALLKRLSNEAKEHIKAGTYNQIEDISKTKVINVKGYFSLVMKIPKTKNPPIDYAKPYESIKNEVVSDFNTLGMNARNLPPHKLVLLYHEAINVAPDATWRENFEYDSKLPISIQVNDPTTEFVKLRKPGLYRLGDRYFRVASMTRAPDYPTLTDAAEFIRKIQKPSGTGIRDNFLFCTQIYYGSKVGDKKKITRNEKTYRFLAQGSREGKAQSTYEAHKHMHEAIEGNGRPIKISSSVAIFGNSEVDCLEKANEVVKHLKSVNKYNFVEEKFIGHGIFFGMFPMNLLPKKADIMMIGRFKDCSPEDASRMLPIVSEWRGLGSPVSLFVGRSGQILPFNFFDTGSNYNWLGMAMSGSGKSVMANRFVSDYLSCGAKTFIIDQGHSYRTTCELFNGTYITFDGDNCPNLNPFPQISDWDGEDAEAPMVVGVICEMIGLNPKKDKLEWAIVDDITNRVWEKYGTKAEIDYIYDLLISDADDSKDTRFGDLALRLKKWTTHGVYGKFYSEGKAINFESSRLIVLDIDALKDKDDLSRAVILQLILQINKYIYSKMMNNDSSWTMMLIDEAWKFMAEGGADEHNAVLQFILTAYRQFRKHNASIGLLVQNLEDVYANPAGKAIADNAAVKIFLGQNAETVNDLVKKDRIDLSPYWVEQLKTVSTFKVKGGFSELFILSKNTKGVARLALAPFTLKVFGTESEDRTMIRQMRNNGHTLEEAIDYVAQERA